MACYEERRGNVSTRGDRSNKDRQHKVHNLADLSSHRAAPASEWWYGKLHTHDNGPATTEATEPRSCSLQIAEHWTPVQALLSMAQRCSRRVQFNAIRTDNLLPRQIRIHTYHDYGGDRKTDDQGRQTTTTEERPTTTMATTTTRQRQQ